MVNNFVINLDKVDKTYQENDIIAGDVEIDVDQEYKHDGIFLTIIGTIDLENNRRRQRLFQSDLKPIVVINRVEQLESSGKLRIGKLRYRFQMKLEPKSGFKLYETYHGFYTRISYAIKCDIKRNFLVKDFSCVQEIIVQNVTKKRLQPVTRNFSITNSSLQLRIIGYLDNVECNIDEPIVGEIVVKKCDLPIKSINVQLNRIETSGYLEDSFQNETEVKNIQIADGDILRDIGVPIYLLLPRLACCPLLITANFQIEFNIKIIVQLENDQIVEETMVIQFHRCPK